MFAPKKKKKRIPEGDNYIKTPVKKKWRDSNKYAKKKKKKKW